MNALVCVAGDEYKFNDYNAEASLILMQNSMI